MAPATLRQRALKLFQVTLAALCALGAVGVQGSVLTVLTLELALVAHAL